MIIGFIDLCQIRSAAPVGLCILLKRIEPFSGIHQQALFFVAAEVVSLGLFAQHLSDLQTCIENLRREFAALLRVCIGRVIGKLIELIN